MDNTAVAVFLRHLYLSAAKIDVDDMIHYVQKLHGLLPDMKFEGIIKSKLEKIQILITGLHQRHPTALFYLLDYLIANEFQSVSDSIAYEVTRCMLNSEELTQNALQTVQSIDGKNKSAAGDTDITCADLRVEPTVTVASESPVDSIKMEMNAKSIRTRDAKRIIKIANDGISKEIVDKTIELNAKHKEGRIVWILGVRSGRAIEIFHPTNSSVCRVSKYLDAPTFMPVRDHHCHLVDENQVLILFGATFDILEGKRKDDDICHETVYLNLNTFAVKEGPYLPQPISFASAASLIGTLYICGGAAKWSIKSVTNACYKLVDNNQKWAAISSLNIARCHHTMSALNGHLYVIGGLNVNSKKLKSVECYEPLTDKWIVLKNQLNYARWWTASAVHRGQIWVTGGGKEEGETIRSSEVFDPITEKWSRGPRLNQKRSSHSMVEFCGKMYVIGGIQNPKSMEVFNDDTNKWELVNHVLKNNCVAGGFVVIE